LEKDDLFVPVKHLNTIAIYIMGLAVKRIILNTWDNKQGPIFISQYPPAETYPSKDLMLKVWAKHEISPAGECIVIVEDDMRYVSYMYGKNDKKYFIILELDPSDELNICEEIFKTHTGNLINSIETNQFNHVLHDIYRQIKNYSELTEQELFMFTFKDKTRVTIFQLLREAIISKSDLIEKLYDKYKIKPESIEIFLAPLYRLNLLTLENLPGMPNNIFFLYDCFLAQYPPEFVKKIEDKELLRQYIDYYKEEHIISDEEMADIAGLLADPSICKFVEELKQGPIKLSEVSEKYNIKDSTIEKLIRFKFILVINNVCHLLGEFRFTRFKPTYLITPLKKRLQNGEISIDQIIRQIELLSENNY
jgi:DNA-binding transcriptional ArsR family regulator